MHIRMLDLGRQAALHSKVKIKYGAIRSRVRRLDGEPGEKEPIRVDPCMFTFFFFTKLAPPSGGRAWRNEPCKSRKAGRET